MIPVNADSPRMRSEIFQSFSGIRRCIGNQGEDQSQQQSDGQKCRCLVHAIHDKTVLVLFTGEEQVDNACGPGVEYAAASQFVQHPADESGDNTRKGLITVLQRCEGKQIPPFHMILNSCLAVLPVFGAFVSVLLPAMDVHEVFALGYDILPGLYFLFAIMTDAFLYVCLRFISLIVFQSEKFGSDIGYPYLYHDEKTDEAQ